MSFIDPSQFKEKYYPKPTKNLSKEVTEQLKQMHEVLESQLKHYEAFAEKINRKKYKPPGGFGWESIKYPNTTSFVMDSCSAMKVEEDSDKIEDLPEEFKNVF